MGHMNGDANVLRTAFLAPQERHQIVMHCPMIWPEFGFERVKVELSAGTITGRLVAVGENAFAFVYAFLDGAHGEEV